MARLRLRFPFIVAAHRHYSSGMFVKITQSGPRRYVQLVEAYRDDAGRPKQRTVATLGRLDQAGEPLRSVHEGLARILGLEPGARSGTSTASFESSRAFGDVWALTQIWKQLGLDRMRHVLRQRTRHRIDLEALLRVMVINRLCDADSKLGVLRWVKTVSLPDMDLASVGHQQLLRTLDAMVEHQAVIEQVLTDAVRPMVNEDLSVVFYDMTTVRAEGLSEQAHEIRQFGKSKESIIARQFMLGLVQTAEGVPLYHEIFPGNTAEVSTLQASLEKVLQRFPIRRVIAVADRGLLSIENMEALQKITLPSGQPLEFILAVPGRRYNDFAELLPLESEASDAERIHEQTWQGLRLVVAHAMDGKLLLVTNTADLPPEEVVTRYKSLADIERGFKVLKSDIEIGPVYHRLPQRIRAHAMVCFIALVLQRVMRARLYEKPVPDVESPARALSVLSRIQTHRVTLAGQRPVTGISALDAEQFAVLDALKVKRPTMECAYINL